MLIKNRSIVSDKWQTLSLAEAQAGALPPDAALILPLQVWLAQREQLSERAALGVWLDSHEDPAAIAADLPRLAVVAINFPKFTDGRGFSSARLLRERYGYRGELRAIGEVLRDQLQEMARCGFDAFALRADQDAQGALAAFADFSDAYQSTVTQPQPLFRRRAA